MAVVVSEPLRELVGGGENAKYIKECTEMYLCGKGIEKIRGFEPFVNLESLWINGNKLKKLNNLDNQKRLKSLYAHDNQICTLKGSLTIFKFLEMLDLSNNQLRDLEKQIKVLEKFKFLQELNLKGNPMCEEPDYRLIVIHRMPGLKVLDQHAISPLERRKAAGVIGGDVATLTVAFGVRVPPYDPAWDEKVPERSVLEQDMSKEAIAIRENMRHEAYMKERGMYMHDPHPEPPRGSSLPPNAGTVRAMQVWRQQQETQQQQQGAPVAGPTAALANETAQRDSGIGAGSSSRGVISGTGSAAMLGTRQQQGQGGQGKRRGAQSGRSGSLSGTGSGGGRSPADGRSPSRTRTTDSPDGYVPRDQLVLYTLRSGQDPLAGQGAAGTALAKPPPGSIRFEQQEYEQFLQQKAAGSPGWQLGKAVVQL
ncbi:hypothetical protein Vafri_14415 [Volvox africanus]|uniref:Uncharacterized protein n=2 Tax=Volvox africanus TaxID=51714 RepID=A0A8J4BDF3_9CHLO|nr:hypothetical protein Vafri_14415 [Volvox africanus]